MANTLRCNDCGSVEIEILQDGSGLGRCTACGALVILPREPGGEIVNLLNLAYLQRSECNFDSAITTYQYIIERDPGEIAAYEGILLAKYGIEYVRDRRYNRYVPTCHRAHFKSVYEDEDYKRYLSLCTPDQRGVFLKRAREIDELQKAVARQLENEEDFDVFICYKSTDQQGQPTEDSLIARDVYDALVRRNYRVFFAEKTLENRLGENYEPIIFKALVTCQVFLLVGTSRENVESVWVRNEWSRFLDRVRDPGDKEITASAFIPVFKGMSPYDMPRINNRLVQGVDAGKLGYLTLIGDGVDRLLRRGIYASPGGRTSASAAQGSPAGAASDGQKGVNDDKGGGYDWNRKYDPFIGEASAAQKYGTTEFVSDVKRISKNVANSVKTTVTRAFVKPEPPGKARPEHGSGGRARTVTVTRDMAPKSAGFQTGAYPNDAPSAVPPPSARAPRGKNRIPRDVGSYFCLAISLLLLLWSFSVRVDLAGTRIESLGLLFQVLLWGAFAVFQILFLVLRFKGRGYPAGSTARIVRGLVIAVSVVLMAATFSTTAAAVGSGSPHENPDYENFVTITSTEPKNL